MHLVLEARWVAAAVEDRRHIRHGDMSRRFRCSVRRRRDDHDKKICFRIFTQVEISFPLSEIVCVSLSNQKQSFIDDDDN